MFDLLKKSAKSAASMFVVGVLLAFAAPFLADLVGFETFNAAANQPLWLGAFFGGFGALTPLVEPAINFLFGDGKHQDVTMAKCPNLENSLEVTNTPVVEHKQKIDNTKYRQMVDSNRLQAAQQSR